MSKKENKEIKNEAAEKPQTDSAVVSEKAKKIKTPADKKKHNMKKLKYGGIATVFTVFVIAVVVLVNVIIAAVGKRTDLSLDLTQDSIFAISQETTDYLAKLESDIEIVTMVDETVFETSTNVYYKQAYEVLKKYAMTSDKITLKFVDMTADPTYVNRYNEIYKGTISEYNIVVSCGSRIKVFSINDLFNSEIDYQTYQTYITSSKAEEVITSAIMYVTDPDPMQAVIFNVESAGGSSANVKSILENNGMDVSSIDPLTEAIPEDADLIVIDAPLNDFSEDIIDKLYAFLENGGKYGKNLIYLAGYSQKETKNIDAFLAEWGIQVASGVVGETDSNNLASASTYYAIKNYIKDNDYSKNVAQSSLPVISYNARPVNILFENSGNVSTVPLLTTADTAFLLTPEMNELAQSGTDPEIVNAAYNTMALSHKYTFDENNNSIVSNVLVIGSSEMLDASLTSTAYYNNGDYFVSILNTMTGKTAGLSIVAKDLSAKTFEYNDNQYKVASVCFLVLIPIGIVATGIVVWLRRRHK